MSRGREQGTWKGASALLHCRERKTFPDKPSLPAASPPACFAPVLGAGAGVSRGAGCWRDPWPLHTLPLCWLSRLQSGSSGSFCSFSFLPRLVSSCCLGICQSARLRQHTGSCLQLCESRAMNQGGSFRARYIIINVISVNHLHVQTFQLRRIRYFTNTR